MAADAQSVASFYATTLGGITSRMLRRHLLQIWPDLTGLSVLGLGYGAPYLRAWRGQAARCIAASPPQIGCIRWPQTAPNLTCAVNEEALPFPDLYFDRVLLVHGLEVAENARSMLREVWRVMKDDGRLLVVAPNRVGLWAHVESTPFGHGQPYSVGQIERLLAARLFRLQRRSFALYMPPSRWRLIVRGARVWEQTGQWLAPNLGGVTLAEAVKDAYATVPLKPARTRRVVLSEAA